jgi:ribosomal protein S11
LEFDFDKKSNNNTIVNTTRGVTNGILAALVGCTKFTEGLEKKLDDIYKLFKKR